MKTLGRRTVRFTGRMYESVTRGFYHRYLVDCAHPRRLVFVFGCQRSGTSALMRCFERDLRVKSYGAFGLSNDEPSLSIYPDAGGRRLKPLQEIRDSVRGERVPFLVAKSLRESQRAGEILDFFPEGRGVWIYRRFRDVAQSFITKWGEGVGRRKLQPIYDGDTGTHWVSERVSVETRETVRRLFSPDMPPADAAALNWYCRNVLFYDLGLEDRAEMLVCRYEDFARHASRVLKGIYLFLGYEYPGDRVVAHVHSRAIGSGRQMKLSASIEALCRDLLTRLDTTYDAQSLRLSTP